MSNPSEKVAYLVSKFPTLTETFILREIVALERRGVAIQIYTIRRESPEVIHEEARPYLDGLRTAPSIALSTLWVNLIALFRHPGVYLALIMLTVRELWGSWHLFARDLYLFPRAVVFAAMMRRDQITHIHAHWATHTAYMAYIIHRLTGIPYSFTAHAHDLYIRKAMLCHKVKAAQFVATISQFNVEELVQDCGEAVRAKLHVVRCGVLPEHLDVPRHSHPDQPLTIVTIASLRDYKGLEYAIQAAALLRDSIDFRWRVVGTGPDRESLQAQIDAAGLHDRFQLIGGRSEQAIRDLLSEADLCVMSSVIMPDRRMEGIPVSLMESLAAGVPTIATRISGIPELVIEGVTGRLVPERDSQALADAIHAYHTDRSAWQPLIVAGKAHVQAEFLVDHNATRLQRLFASSAERYAAKTSDDPIFTAQV